MTPMYINSDIHRGEYKEKAAALLKMVDIDSRAAHYPKELSGGEQQRVAIARALANDPLYIFADEPTGSLDDKNEQNILSILKGIAEAGKAVVIVTHDKTVEEIADKRFHMNSGVLEEEK